MDRLRHRRLRAAYAVRVLTVVLVALLLGGTVGVAASRRRGAVAGTPTAGATLPSQPALAVPLTASAISISLTQLGAPLSSLSTGLSMETSSVTQPSFGAGNLTAFLQALGPSTMRVGGNSADLTFWTATGETAPSWAQNTLTPQDLARLAKVAAVSGWRIILAVNLRHRDPARAADEVEHATALLGASLSAVEIGNEPNDYYTSTSAYRDDFQAYTDAIHAAAPDVPIVGSDTDTRSFQDVFVNQQLRLPRPSIVALTQHYYPLYRCHNDDKRISDLFSETVYNEESQAAQRLSDQAALLRMPAMMDEVNSVACGGQVGLSDVYAAALWALDVQLLMAQTGISGTYMQGNTDQCSQYAAYSPLCAATAADAASGTLTPQPEYYGLAAVHEVGTGHFATVFNPTQLRVYAVVGPEPAAPTAAPSLSTALAPASSSTPDPTISASGAPDEPLTVVLINLADPATAKATTAALFLGGAYTSGLRVDLSASSLTARTGITLGRQIVGTDGRMAALDRIPITVSRGSLTVEVPAGSAAIMTFR